MSWTRTWAWAVAMTVGNVLILAQGRAQLSLLPETPQAVFAGQDRTVNLRWHNAGMESVDVQVRARLFQSSGTLAAPLGEQPPKALRLLPQQTLLETAQLDFPTVRAETRFVVQWVTDSQQVIGRTEVLVYPTNLLTELGLLLDGGDLGLFDPQAALKPALRQNGVSFLDLMERPLDDFSGKLAVIGPFPSRAQLRGGFNGSVRHMARQGAAVVWIQPPRAPDDELRPSFYRLSLGKGALVMVQPELVADFSVNPLSQLNLIYLCKWALNPAPGPD
ncbi:MAG TPA: hypothetical protein VF988_06630 [Verrucomicrobiae bacterium]